MRIRRADRLTLEEELLRETFGPSWHLQGTKGQTSHGMIGELRTNDGNCYIVFVPVAGFPDAPPAAYVLDPVLARRDGKPLPELSHQFHTRERDAHGNVQICHYDDDAWDASVTVYKVVLKVRIWLEAYERYRATGKAIHHFLAAMTVD